MAPNQHRMNGIHISRVEIIVCILVVAGLCATSPAMSQVRYTADVQLIDPVPNPNDILPPGPNIINFRAIIDTGSPFTFVDLTQSVALGFGTVTVGPPRVYTAQPAFVDTANPTQQIGGVGGAARLIARTRALNVNAGGEGRDMVRYQTVAGLHVLNPLPAASLIGTDFIIGLPQGQSLMIRRDGSATFFGHGNSPSTAFEMRSGPFPGTGRWVFPSGTVGVAGPAGSERADFAIVTGAGYTIIGRTLAARLGLAQMETITLDDGF